MATLYEYGSLGSSTYLSSDYSNYQQVAMVGQIHNMSLDAIANTPGFPNLTFGEKIEVIRNVVTQTNEAMGVTAEANFPTEFISQTIADIKNAPSPKDYVESTLFDSQRNMTQVMYTALLPLLSYSIPPGITETEIFPIQSALLAGELAVASSKFLSPETKLIVVGTVNILRYSSQYWYIAEQDSQHPWYDIVNSETPPAGGKKWFWRALRDAVGFTGGALIGMSIGGPPVAAAGGAVVGAAASADSD